MMDGFSGCDCHIVNIGVDLTLSIERAGVLRRLKRHWIYKFGLENFK